MDALQFCYWLQGYVEIAASRTAPTSQEWEVIKQHLALVFNKIPPPFIGVGSPPPICFPPWNPPWNDHTGNPPPFAGGPPFTGVTSSPTDFWKSNPLCGTDTTPPPTPLTASPSASSLGSFSSKIGGVIPKFDVKYEPARPSFDVKCIFPNCTCNPMNPDCANNGIVIHQGNTDVE